MPDLSLKEISNRIADSVLDMKYINKTDLSTKILPILRIWMKKANEFKSVKASKPKLIQTIETRGLQQKFWLHKFRDIIGSENMQPYYDELDEILFKEGYKKKEN